MENIKISKFLEFESISVYMGVCTVCYVNYISHYGHGHKNLNATVMFQTDRS